MKKTLRVLPAVMLAAALYLIQPVTPAQADAEETISALVNYIPNVIHDVIGIFDADISVGGGYGLDVRATRVFEAGYSDYKVDRYGLHKGEVVAEDASDVVGCTILGFTIGDAAEDAYDIAATVHLFVLGIEVGGNLRALLDAVTGLVFIDLEDDNVNMFE